MLAGCYSIGIASGVVLAPVDAALQATVTALSPDFPDEVVKLQAESPSEILEGARYASPSHELEYARRLEYGVGVTRDPVCAYVIYQFNRGDYGVDLTAKKGVSRIEKYPEVAIYAAKGPRRDISACIPGHIAAGNTGLLSMDPAPGQALTQGND